MIVGSVMTDHPSWIRRGDVSARTVRCGSSVWLLLAEPVGSGVRTTAHALVGGHADDQPVLDVVDPGDLPDGGMADALRASGTVGRWRNPDPWDALATAIVRQVIRAGQARKLYREFCDAHGRVFDTPVGPLALFPTPHIVLDLPDSEYARLGLAFKRRPLQAAAAACLDFETKWSELPAVDLRQEIQLVPRVGPWTAGATVADLTNDYALYPYADLAVRTWANRLAPGRRWPDAEDEFAYAWTRLAAEQLSDWTLLTLAWGVRHANTTGSTAL